MVINLLKFVANEVKDRNLYFDNFTPIAYQQEDGKVYKFTTSTEREYCGLSDTEGAAFYIKVNPVATFTPGKQLTSSKRVSEGTIECTLVAYQANGEINTINWQSKLTHALKSINFSGYTDREKHIRIEIRSTNNDAQQIYKQETGKDLESDLKAIAISYNLIFQSNEFDCEECNIFDTENQGCDPSPEDVCQQYISRFNNLPVPIKECVLDAICTPCADVTIYESDGTTISELVPSGGSYTKIACPPVPTCFVSYASPFMAFTLNGDGSLSIDLNFTSEILVCGHILMRRGENDNSFSQIGPPVLYSAAASGVYQLTDPAPLVGVTLYQVITYFTNCAPFDSDPVPYQI